MQVAGQRVVVAHPQQARALREPQVGELDHVALAAEALLDCVNESPVAGPFRLGALVRRAELRRGLIERADHQQDRQPAGEGGAPHAPRSRSIATATASRPRKASTTEMRFHPQLGRQEDGHDRGPTAGRAEHEGRAGQERGRGQALVRQQAAWRSPAKRESAASVSRTSPASASVPGQLVPSPATMGAAV